MEPQLPTPREVAPDVPSTGELSQEAFSVGADVISSSPEQQLQPTPTPTAQTIQQAPPTPDPGVTQATLDNTQPQLTSGQSGPAIADDVDVIEKEWVDKAKKIVSTTKDDPYNQEKQVSQLQADYLMKRYGKKIKTVD